MPSCPSVPPRGRVPARSTGHVSGQLVRAARQLDGQRSAVPLRHAVDLGGAEVDRLLLAVSGELPDDALVVGHGGGRVGDDDRHLHRRVGQFAHQGSGLKALRRIAAATRSPAAAAPTAAPPTESAADTAPAALAVAAIAVCRSVVSLGLQLARVGAQLLVELPHTPPSEAGVAGVVQTEPALLAAPDDAVGRRSTRRRRMRR